MQKEVIHKTSLVFMVKNLYFILDNLSKLGLVKGAQDVRLYRSDLEKSVEKYI